MDTKSLSFPKLCGRKGQKRTDETNQNPPIVLTLEMDRTTKKPPSYLFPSFIPLSPPTDLSASSGVDE